MSIGNAGKIPDARFNTKKLVVKREPMEIIIADSEGHWTLRFVQRRNPFVRVEAQGVEINLNISKQVLESLEAQLG